MVTKRSATGAQNFVRSKKEERQDIGSLRRGLAVLEELNRAVRPVTASELADRIRLPVSSLHRVLQVLKETGHVCQDQDRRYFSSPHALCPLDLSHPLNLVRREAMDVLRRLRTRFNQSTAYVLYLGDERLVLERAEATEAVAPYYDTYLKNSLHASVSGKLLLAHRTVQRRTELLGPAPYQAHTASTIVEEKQLAAELQRVREQGFALSVDEQVEGLTVVGAGFVIDGTLVGSVVLAGLSAEFTGDLEAIGEEIRREAHLHALGARALKLLKSLRQS